MSDPLEQLGNALPESSGKIALCIIVAKILGQAYSALKSEGGLRGLYRGVLLGENVPKAISDDYRPELKIKPPNENEDAKK